MPSISTGRLCLFLLLVTLFLIVSIAWFCFAIPGTHEQWLRYHLLGAFSSTALWMVENRRATRIKVLVHDGFGVRLAAHRLTQGKFHWPSSRHGAQMEFTPSSFRRG